MRRTEARQQLVRWVAREIMPHEPLVRAWLARSMVSREDSDDLIQDAYCRIAELERFEHIDRPAAFFFSVVRNLFLTQLRRARVVRIESAAEIETLAGADDLPSPERIAGDRREYARVRDSIDRLPERCRRIFELRKIEGVSQREIADRLGIAETIVENEGARGLRLVLEAMRAQGGGIAEHYAQIRAGKANRR
ncbi:MAG: sigma-70 family RNA polymerase sigma factor [Pseudomonadota bacterium]|uniref:RNA polymerase sigma factor n=1 Tax=Sphingomonas sp. ERG5 TaxID=1381597 RepID=UPI00054B53D0|nr:sigma-70 family RNA polymerase sigma factor [Sphingomonas sp. ERG5]